VPYEPLGTLTVLAPDEPAHGAVYVVRIPLLEPVIQTDDVYADMPGQPKQRIDEDCRAGAEMAMQPLPQAG
jgi:hypothetical protein